MRTTSEEGWVEMSDMTTEELADVLEREAKLLQARYSGNTIPRVVNLRRAAARLRDLKVATAVQPATIAIVRGVEGLAIYINEFRVCGPKPWGGGTPVQDWTVSAEDMSKALGRTE